MSRAATVARSTDKHPYGGAPTGGSYNAFRDEPKRIRYTRMMGELRNERSSFISQWSDLADFQKPRRGRFQLTDVNRGDRRNQRIYDAEATLALRTLSSGMMSGVTSPARPWFRLTLPDPDLATHGPVKQWLYTVTQRMLTTFQKTNLYNALSYVYTDMGGFGTACVFAQPHPTDVLRFTVFPVGSYFLANDADLRVGVFAREYMMTVRQIVKRFGLRPGNVIDWSRISPTVKSLWMTGKYEQWIPVSHVVEPNEGYAAGRLGAQYKRFSSCYFEPGSPQMLLLEETGYDDFPVLAPRWEVCAGDVYGTDCPGMTAIGDVKQLQHGERRGMQILDKITSPPLVAPPSARNVRISAIPSDISYIQEGQNTQVRPLYEVNPGVLAPLDARQQAKRELINRAYYADLFLMMAQSDRREITAREVDERHEEKLLALGPVLQQTDDDLLNPLIDLTFAELMERGQIPEPPEEIQGRDLRVDYISLMAQAQKMVGLAGIDRFNGYLMQRAEAGDTTAIDVVDVDEMTRDYGEMSGVQPKILRDQDAIDAMRQQRARAQQAEASAEQAAKLAPAAKQLSETKVPGAPGGSALSALIGGDVGSPVGAGQ